MQRTTHPLWYLKREFSKPSECESARECEVMTATYILTYLQLCRQSKVLLGWSQSHIQFQPRSLIHHACQHTHTLFRLLPSLSSSHFLCLIQPCHRILHTYIHTYIQRYIHTYIPYIQIVGQIAMCLGTSA